MAIHYEPGPADGTMIVRSGLAQFSAHSNIPTAFRDGGSSALTLMPPHAVYDLRVDEISQGRGLDAVHKTGYRYLITADPTSVAAAEVHISGDQATFLANVNYGRFAAATARAIERLSALDLLRSKSYELRLLRISALGLMTIWLKSEDGGDDKLYPLEPTPDGLTANTLYSVSDFLKAVSPLAKARAASGATKALP